MKTKVIPHPGKKSRLEARFREELELKRKKRALIDVLSDIVVDQCMKHAKQKP